MPPRIVAKAPREQPGGNGECEALSYPHATTVFGRSHPDGQGERPMRSLGVSLPAAVRISPANLAKSSIGGRRA